MFKGVVLGIVLTLGAALIAGYAILRSGRVPVNADASAGGMEIWLASTTLDAAIEREAPRGPNPVSLSDRNLLAGVNLFAQNCAVCHGNASGTAAPSRIAQGLYPRPPQLATDGVEDDPQGASFWRIKHGIRLTGMPSFGRALSDQEIWTLALFLKNMDKLPPAVQQAWEKVRNWPNPTMIATARN
jgi:thiosulfate dehydrogenase